ncbi:MAG: GNAT family N-acetyltransferase [Chthoniobacterales bacterium]
MAKIVGAADLRGSVAWRDAFRGKCKDHRFYEIIEETLASDFEYHYLVLEDLTGIVRAVQPLFFVQQNIDEGVPNRIRSGISAVRQLFPRFLSMRVLMVGCAAGEGHLGTCLVDDEAWVAEALHASLKTYARRCKASLVVLKDFPARYREALRGFSQNGYARVPSMPMTRLSLPYGNFEEYLGSLSKATRKDLRRKFRKTEKAPPIQLEVVEDITPYIDEVYPLYVQVHERSRLKFERLTKDYFCSVGQRMPDVTRFFVWRQLGKVVAFSLCMVYGTTIYDEYLGLDYSVALDLHLYFYTLRDIITWSLEHGLDSYCSSPLNYQPKLHLGCNLLPLDLYVMHTTSLINPIFRRALKFLEPTRHERVLQQFPNANEL